MINKDQFYTFMKVIPKAEIHLHSEGVISKDTVLKLLQKAHPERACDLTCVDGYFNFSNLSEFVEMFLAIQKAFINPSDFDILFEDMRNYLIDNGIVYSETFISPTSFIRNGLDFEKIIERVIKSIRKIKKNDHITIKLIIDMSRTFGTENAMNNLNIALDLRNRYSEIIGVGLGGDEAKGPASKFVSVFEKARSEGLKVVAHAGESIGPESVWDTISLLKVDRIGHGISSIFDKKLIQTLIAKKIPLEVCPTSNIFTKHYFSALENHPIREFYDSGMAITLNTDDPTFFGIGLIDEYYNLYTKLHFSMDEIKQIVLNSFKYSFLPANQKDTMMKSVEDVWSAHSGLLQ